MAGTTTGISLLPEPRRLEATGATFPFDGFNRSEGGLPAFIAREFDIPQGRWKVRKVDAAGRTGSGLQVTEGEVVCWGQDSVAYATIVQLLRQGRDRLPEIAVEHAFHFPFRGFHLDIGRGGVPTVETFKRLLRWLFVCQYNYLGIYFEDLFPWSAYPQIGAHRGRLAPDELRETIDYGAQLGIEVFPSLELAGHMEHILALPEFMSLSEWHWPREGCLDLSNEKACELAYDLLREVVAFFPSRYVHVGGDETWSLGRGKGLDKTWAYDGPALYERHHRRLIEIVCQAGKEPIIWGDIIAGSIQMGDMISKEAAAKWTVLLDSDAWQPALIANWDYHPAAPPDYFKGRMKPFQERGLRQIASTSTRSEGKYYPNFSRGINNNRN
jgi:hexosaminidase